MGLLDQLPQGGLLAGMSQQDKALMLLQMGAATLASNTGNYGRAGPAIGAGLGAGANYMAQGPERAYKAMQMKQFEEKMKQEAREREQAEAANNDWKAAIGDNSHLSDDPNFAPGGLLAGTPMPESQFNTQDPNMSLALKLSANNPALRAQIMGGLLKEPDKINYNQAFLPDGSPNIAYQQYELNKTRAGRAPQAPAPYYTFLPTVDGYAVGDARSGNITPGLVDGNRVMRATDDPKLQGDIAAAKSEGEKIGEQAANINVQEGASKAVSEGLKLLDQGIYTGGYADLKRIAAKYTPGVDTAKVSRTEQFLSHVGNTVIPRLVEFGGNDSNEELAYLKAVMGGNITLEEDTLRTVLKSSDAKINRGIARVRNRETIYGGGRPPAGAPAASGDPSYEERLRQALED